MPRKVSVMDQGKAGDLLQKIFSKAQLVGTVQSNGSQKSNSQYSSHWESYLKFKGAYYSLSDMLKMRSPGSSITRGFGLDRRFSPSFDYYREQSVYKDILSIPESDFGDPEKLFYGVNGERRSGIFLRNACYAYEIITRFKRERNSSFNILEIGSGFGMLAYILKHYYKNAKLFLVDLPETLATCAWYLENAFPDSSFLYCPADTDDSIGAADVIFINAEAFKIGMTGYDLVINCDSMSEMTADVACNYLSIIEADMYDDGMFFFLNKEGIDKEAMARPTLYPFSMQWVLESIRPTYVGFQDDYRHIQICLRRSTRQLEWPVWLGKLLDLAYQYFYEERLECFSMFEFLEGYKWDKTLFGDELNEFIYKCIVGSDLTYCAQNWRVLHKESWASDLERSISGICMIIVCDLLIEDNRENEAEPIAMALSKGAGSFSETWATGRILARLNKNRQAKAAWERSLKIENIPAVLLLKAGKLLEASNCADLAKKAFERVLSESYYPLEKIEAAMRLQMEASQIDILSATLPSYAFSIGYYLVRIATIFHHSGYSDRAYDLLLPIITNQIQAGHYDLFAAAKILDALGYKEKAKGLIQEAIKLGHNDNGFYRKIGLFFEQKGDYISAEKYLKASLDIDVSWASTHYDLARVYQKLGQISLEVDYLEKTLLCSHNKEVDYDALNERLRFLAKSEDK